MGTRFKFNLLVEFQPGEKVLLTKKWIPFCTGLSAPNYRWAFSLPPLMEHGLIVTDRRVIQVFYVFRLFSQEFDQWFDDGSRHLQNDDLIQQVTVGRHWLLGAYLEVISETKKRPWYRSRAARIRVYTSDADRLRQLMTKTIADKSSETLRS